MKILFLPKHEYMGASSRYRTLQYLPYFKKENIDFDVKPLFNDEYLKYKYQNGKENLRITLMRILMRIKCILFDANDYDIVIFEKELIPYFPPFLEWYLNIKKIPYIIDYDDAVWHNYDFHSNLLVRTIFKNKFPKIMSKAKGIIVGSHYIKKIASNYNQNIVLIPTSIEIKKYKVKTNFSNDKMIIGWIGSPSSSQYILNINDVLSEVCHKVNAKVHLIGFDQSKERKLTFPYKLIKWSEETEVEELMKFNIGIMPLSDSLFEKGKCGFKLIQYMGCGLPVIASNIGENIYIVDDNSGFLVENDSDWMKCIKQLSSDFSLQKKLGESGRRKIEDSYSTENNYKKYINFIKDNI